MNYVNLPDEQAEDPNAASRAEGEAFSHFMMEEVLMRRDEHPTGEHPSIEEQIEVARATLLSSSSERISAPRHENEPEDNLPDLLDRNK
jgi:hypothetical protein